MKSIAIEQKSIEIDNHWNKSVIDFHQFRCLSINIDFIDYYGFLSSIEIIEF